MGRKGRDNFISQDPTQRCPDFKGGKQIPPVWFSPVSIQSGWELGLAQTKKHPANKLQHFAQNMSKLQIKHVPRECFPLEMLLSAHTSLLAGTGCCSGSGWLQKYLFVSPDTRSSPFLYLLILKINPPTKHQLHRQWCWGTDGTGVCQHQCAHHCAQCHEACPARAWVCAQVVGYRTGRGWGTRLKHQTEGANLSPNKWRMSGQQRGRCSFPLLQD